MIANNILNLLKIKSISYLMVIVTVIVTVSIGCEAMDKPCTLAGVGFIVWAVSPYGLLAVLIKMTRSGAARLGVLLLCLIACSFGLAVMVDALYIHLDAQSGIVYVIVPLWQWLALLLCMVPVLLLNKLGKKDDARKIG